MLQQQQQMPVERRVRSAGVVKKVIELRGDLLACYSKLVAQRPFNRRDGVVPLMLQRFCQDLVDYTATAHFQLYRHFAESRERRKAVVEVADRIYPRILDITECILDFNDKYDCEDHCGDLRELSDDLSRLGELLADRIELEDELIQAFNGSRR